jgi:arabinofuranan 3-O-arabinosyltransferase
LAVLALWRRRPEAAPALERAPDRPPARAPAGRAALLAVPVALALGFMFAARATPLFGLAAFFILWRGIPARPLALAAGALLLVAVPILTVAIPVDDRGGFNPSYAGDRVAVHWVTVAAVVLLLFALARELAGARNREYGA